LVQPAQLDQHKRLASDFAAASHAEGRWFDPSRDHKYQCRCTTATANDDRLRTMHTVVAGTDRESLPAVVVALMDRNDQRCAERTQAWRRHT
jgi:hypothetical protein